MHHHIPTILNTHHRDYSETQLYIQVKRGLNNEVFALTTTLESRLCEPFCLGNHQRSLKLYAQLTGMVFESLSVSQPFFSISTLTEIVT